jgi:hypothetical protein
MSRDISQANLEQLYDLDSGNAELVLLRVNYDGELLYLVRNFIDITFNSQVYTALPFDVTLPNQNEESSSGAQLLISDVSGDIYGIIRTASDITAEFEIISQTALGAQTSIATFQNMRLSNAEWTDQTATFDLFREDESIYSFPKDTMDNIKFPGLY